MPRRHSHLDRSRGRWKHPHRRKLVAVAGAVRRRAHVCRQRRHGSAARRGAERQRTQFQQHGGSLHGAGGGTIDTNGNTVILSGAISGSTALLKTGAGTLRISGALNVPATIGTGNVVLGGATGTGAFTIQNDASLEGTGPVGSVTAESGGTLAPGNARDRR